MPDEGAHAAGYVQHAETVLRPLRPREHGLGQFLNQLNMIVESDVLDEVWDTIDDDGKGNVLMCLYVYVYVCLCAY